jgi:hypothetical protein
MLSLEAVIHTARPKDGPPVDLGSGKEYATVLFQRTEEIPVQSIEEFPSWCADGSAVRYWKHTIDSETEPKRMKSSVLSICS